MNIFRTLLAVVFSSVLIASALQAGENAKSASGTTEGTFVGIEEGDYSHFLIKDTKGKDDSFIILSADNSVQSYLDNPAKMKGRKVRVFWKEEMIPEAGQKEKTVTKVEAREPSTR